MSASCALLPDVARFSLHHGILASNNAVHADEDGEFSDWIEIPTDAAPVNLDGYYD
jgi:hypothetical protein